MPGQVVRIGHRELDTGMCGWSGHSCCATTLCMNGFSAHPALSHVLNLHLQDNVASRSKFEALEKRVLEVETLAKERSQEDC